MGILLTGELAQIQADVAAVTLDKTCSVSRKAPVADKYGTQVPNYTVLESVPVV